MPERFRNAPDTPRRFQKEDAIEESLLEVRIREQEAQDWDTVRSSLDERGVFHTLHKIHKLNEQRRLLPEMKRFIEREGMIFSLFENGGYKEAEELANILGTSREDFHETAFEFFAREAKYEHYIRIEEVARMGMLRRFAEDPELALILKDQYFLALENGDVSRMQGVEAFITSGDLEAWVRKQLFDEDSGHFRSCVSLVQQRGLGSELLQDSNVESIVMRTIAERMKQRDYAFARQISEAFAIPASRIERVALRVMIDARVRRDETSERDIRAEFALPELPENDTRLLKARMRRLRTVLHTEVSSYDAREELRTALRDEESARLFLEEPLYSEVRNALVESFVRAETVPWLDDSSVLRERLLQDPVVRQAVRRAALASVQNGTLRISDSLAYHFGISMQDFSAGEYAAALTDGILARLHDFHGYYDDALSIVEEARQMHPELVIDTERVRERFLSYSQETVSLRDGEKFRGALRWLKKTEELWIRAPLFVAQGSSEEEEKRTREVQEREALKERATRQSVEALFLQMIPHFQIDTLHDAFTNLPESMQLSLAELPAYQTRVQKSAHAWFLGAKDGIDTIYGKLFLLRIPEEVLLAWKTEKLSSAIALLDTSMMTRLMNLFSKKECSALALDREGVTKAVLHCVAEGHFRLAAQLTQFSFRELSVAELHGSLGKAPISGLLKGLAALRDALRSDVLNKAVDALSADVTYRARAVAHFHAEPKGISEIHGMLSFSRVEREQIFTPDVVAKFGADEWDRYKTFVMDLDSLFAVESVQDSLREAAVRYSRWYQCDSEVLMRFILKAKPAFERSRDRIFEILEATHLAGTFPGLVDFISRTFSIPKDHADFQEKYAKRYENALTVYSEQAPDSMKDIPISEEAKWRGQLPAMKKLVTNGQWKEMLAVRELIAEAHIEEINSNALLWGTMWLHESLRKNFASDPEKIEEGWRALQMLQVSRSDFERICRESFSSVLHDPSVSATRILAIGSSLSKEMPPEPTPELASLMTAFVIKHVNEPAAFSELVLLAKRMRIRISLDAEAIRKLGPDHVRSLALCARYLLPQEKEARQKVLAAFSELPGIGPVVFELLDLKGPADRSAFCPWEQNLQPLVKTLTGSGVQWNVAERAGLVQFVREFGMVHSPILARVRIALEVAKAGGRPIVTLGALDMDYVRQFNESRGRGTSEVLRVLECEQFLAEAQRSTHELREKILNDEPLPEGFETSALQVELLNTLIPKTGHYGNLEDRASVLKAWRNTLRLLSPEATRLPPGYEKRQLQVSLRASAEDGLLADLNGDERKTKMVSHIRERQAVLLKHEPTVAFLRPLEEGLFFAEKLAQEEAPHAMLLASLTGRLGIQARAIADRLAFTPANEGKRTEGLQKSLQKISARIDALERLRDPKGLLRWLHGQEGAALRSLEERVSAQLSDPRSPDTLALFQTTLEAIVSILGDEAVKLAGPELYAGSMFELRGFAPGHVNAIPRTPEIGKEQRYSPEQLRAWGTLFQEEVVPYFLLPHGRDADLPDEPNPRRKTPWSPALTKVHEALWRTTNIREKLQDGVQKVDAVPLHPLHSTFAGYEKLVREIDRVLSGDAGTETMEFFPAHGVARIFAGDLSNACYDKQRHRLANNQFPELQAVIMTHGSGEEREAQGAFLLIEGKDVEGKNTILVRALNPTERALKAGWNPDSLVDAAIEYAKGVANARGLDRVLVGLDHTGGHATNRKEIFEALQRRCGEDPVSQREGKTPAPRAKPYQEYREFNGYNITNGETLRIVWERT